MEIIGYVASVLIGISLGLIGGGGSILTVPVLVYLFAVEPAAATFYSLFVVGTTSGVGSLSYFRRKEISLKTAAVFGLPSIIAVYLARHYLVAAIPDILFTIGDFTLTKNGLLMLLFAVLMVAASYSMIRKRVVEERGADDSLNIGLLVLQGLFVGTVTGLIGAGGGFLIIPALVNFVRLPMKTAVGTSLLIITVNSLSGFFLNLGETEVNWSLLLAVTGIAIIGIVIGSFLASKINGAKLKPAFGWFVLAMGVYILLRQLLG